MSELLRARASVCVCLLLGSLSIAQTAMAFAAGRHSARSIVGALQSAEWAAVHVELLSRTDEPSKHVEIFWTQPKGTGPWPVVVFLHGHQDGSTTPGGKAFVDYGVLDDMATRGYVGVGVSQPGYGHSEGPPDFMGSFTQRAVEQVIEHFRGQSFVRQDRVALEGISRGAIVAGLVATRDPRIRAMVLISGAYDLPALFGPNPGARPGNMSGRMVDELRADIAQETDGSESALRDRSVLSAANRIRTPALIINGTKDDRTDPEQARALARAIQANGVFARALIYPEYGHAIPFDVREQEVRPFLDQYLR
ncbi:MAG TPA: alpha/beta fold hydrolase [Vicinamibacterales bacterium]|nr:alpha/beta fold hydrolase [Vicinamibacterales bacterium]